MELIQKCEENTVVKTAVKVHSTNRIPDEISNHPVLLNALSILPMNYNFELPKTIWRIVQKKSRRVALQFPEGLLMFSLLLADVIETVTNAEVFIMADVTYGACCIDDYSARSMNCDLMVHYGHSCLININEMQGMNVLYVFVDIKIDRFHFLNAIKQNFEKSQRLFLISTIQFLSTLHSVGKELNKDGYLVTIPQSKPLSPGEVLGCTAPRLHNYDAVIYLGDGRFHIESIMLANPDIWAYRYDPYTKNLTQEFFDFPLVKSIRLKMIDDASNCLSWGIILGTLGRQGSLKVLMHMIKEVRSSGRSCCIFLFSEIYPDKLKLISDIDTWVQIACPRLSIDWGKSFSTPLLNTYEAAVALKLTKNIDDCYPMDFYAYESRGPWTPNFKFKL